MRWILVVLFSLALFGCEAHKEVSYDEIIELTKSWKEPKVAIWYYQGSDEKYHYFEYLDLGIKEHYKVTKSGFTIDEIPLSSNRDNWQVMPWGTQADRQNNN